MRIDVYEDYYLKEVAAAVTPEKDVDGGTLDVVVRDIMSYWLAGWDWVSVELIMAEKDYPTDVIDEAFMEAQKQVDEMSRTGPFGTLRSGQFVKLHNGMIGIVAKTTTDTAAVRILDINDTVTVTPNQIDKEGIRPLLRAHCLRKAAASIVDELEKQETAKIARTACKEKSSLHNIYSAIVSDGLMFKDHLDALKLKIEKSGAQKEVHQSVLALVSNQISSMHDVFESLTNANEFTTDMGCVLRVAKDLEKSTEETYKEVLVHVGSCIDNFKKSNSVIINMLDHSDADSIVSYAAQSQRELDNFIEHWEKEIIPKLNTANVKIAEKVQEFKRERLQAELRSAMNH